MTGFLADACALIEFYLARPSVPAEIRSLFEDEPHAIAVSATTTWELEIKTKLGKLVPIRVAGASSLTDTLAHEGLTLLPFDHATAEQAAGLPMLHRDPFDRALVAAAQRTGRTVLTYDPVIARYGVPVLW